MNHFYHKALRISLFILFVVVSLLYSQSSFAVTRTWDNGGGDGLWSNCTNWSGNICPGAADIAQFDNTNTTNSTVDVSFGGTVDGVNIVSGYTGTITQSRNLTVEVTNFIQADGTWDGSTYAMTITGGGSYSQSSGVYVGGSTLDINDGSFTLSGGTFNQPSTTFAVEKNFTISGGTYNGINKTITLDGAANTDDTTITCTGNLLSITGASTIYFNKTGTGDLIIASGCSVAANVYNNADSSNGVVTVSAGATLTSLGNFYGYSLTVAGDMTSYPGTFRSGSAAVGGGVSISAGGSANLSQATLFDIENGGVTVNAGGTLAVGASTLYIEQNLTINGSFNITGKDLVFDGVNTNDDTTISCSGNYNSIWGINSLTFNKSGVGDVVISNGCTATANMNNSASGVDGVVNINAGGTLVTTGAFYAYSLTVSGSLTTAAAAFKVGSAAAGAGFNVTNGGVANLSQVTSFDIDQGSVDIDAGGSLSVGVSTLYIEHNLIIDGTFDISGKNLVFDGANVSDHTTITCSGNYNTLTGINSLQFNKVSGSANVIVDSGCTVTANMNNSATATDGAVAVNANGTLYTTGNFYAYSLNVSGYLETGAGTFDVGSAASGGGITINSGGHANLNQSTSFDMDQGNLTVSAGGTLSIGASTLYIEGSFTNSGYINALSSKYLVFDGANNTDDTTYTNTTPVAGITVSKTNATPGDFILASNATVTGDFTRTDGIINNPGAGYTLYVGGNLTLVTTDNFGGANFTLEFNGTGTQNITVTNQPTTFDPIFKINKASGEVQLLQNLTQNTRACNIVEGTFNLSNKNFTCGGAFTVEDGGTLKRSGLETFTTTGGLTLSSGSTVEFTGDGDAAADTITITTMATNFHHLKVNSKDGATDTFQLGANIDMNGNFNLAAGTFDVTATPRNMTVGGNWTRTGGTFVERTGKVTFDTAGTLTTVSGSSTFYGFESTTNNKNITFAASSTTVVTSAFTLTGTAGNEIILRSDTTGTYWNIKSNGTESVSYVNVRDSDARSGGEILANNSSSVGWNPNWNFGAGTPYSPSNLGSITYVTGQAVTDNTPTLTFDIDDPANENVGFRIQIDDTANFSSVVLDYTSALGSEGSKSFTVGQAASGGTYIVGGEGTHLPKGDYYWRVSAYDVSLNVSGDTTANSGNVAFYLRSFTVTKTADTNDGSCNSDCSLREAIVAVNADASTPRYIHFNIPGATDGGCSGAGGICTISPTSYLGAISAANLTIDGYTQSGAVQNSQNFPGGLNTNLRIVVDGTSAGNVNGLYLSGGNGTVRGLSIVNYAGAAGNGIVLVSNNNRIQGNFIGIRPDGTTMAGNRIAINMSGTRTGNVIGIDDDGTGMAGERNLVSGNTTYGIAWLDDTKISGNLVGTDSSGMTSKPNPSNPMGSNAVVGTNGDGTSDAFEGNIFSGNSGSGLSLFDSNTIVAGNYIGVDATGNTALPNGSNGIFETSTGTSCRIGTNGDNISDALERNVISGNTTYGINLNNDGSHNNNTIAGNYIGIGADGSTAVENKTHGIIIQAGNTGNVIGGDTDAESNIIAYNGDAASEYGIYIAGATSDGNDILRNRFFSNQNEGIKLAGDGANNNQPAPVISGRSISTNTITISGTGTVGATVQLYDASSDDEGENYMEQNTVDGAGNWSITVNKSAYTAKNNELVATVTDATNGTSGFSSAFTLTSTAPNAPTNLGPTAYTTGLDTTDTSPTVTFNIDDPDNDSVSFRIQFDDNSDFSSPVIDYTSSLAAEGTLIFTPGDTAGTYAIGSQYTRLPYGNIYWQVKSIDFYDEESTYTTARGGLIALVERIYTVSKTADTNDGTCNTDCSMREAIVAANANATYYTIEFSINPDADSGCNSTTDVCSIVPATELTTITRSGLLIDGYTQYGASAGTQNFPNAINAVIKINIDGSSAPMASDGIAINAGSVTIKGLSITNFDSNGSAMGIFVADNAPNDNIRIQGNYLGVLPDGETTSGNYHGLYVWGLSQDNLVIGTNGDGINDAAERNLISGNVADGINASPGSGFRVSGNFIGTDKDGTVDLGCADDGIDLGADSSYIGTNGDGVSDSYEGNLISGNNDNGISSGAGINYIHIRGNYIGTDRTGLLSIPNTNHGISSASEPWYIGTNADGTSDAQERNIISGNGQNGISLSFTPDVSRSWIKGNYIGLGADGTTVVGNGTNGIYCSTICEGILIGTDGNGQNDAMEANYISGNGGNGIELGDQSHTVAGNFIGVTINGSDAGNGTHGILLNGANADYITIGGDSTVKGNTIAYNGNAAAEYGVYLNNAGTDANQILYNRFYNNQNEGILLVAGANNDKAAPSFTSVASSGTGKTITGSVSGSGDIIQIFDADSDNQEGQTFITQVTASGTGWNVTVYPPYSTTGNNIVATATDMTNGTSRFSTAYSMPSVPPSVSNLGPTNLINGSVITDTTPTFTFDVTDPDTADSGDQVGYRIQIDDSSDFSSVVVDYEGTYNAVTAKSFTVGQAEGTGNYNSGFSGQTLHYGKYFWRALGMDSTGQVGSYVTANAGGTAFTVNVLTVTVTSDATDGTCNADCSLRDALTISNATTSIDNIEFNIPTTDPGNVGGICTITPSSTLPFITNAGLTINGYSQSGASPGTNNFPSPINASLKVVIDGTSAGAAVDGLTVNNVGNVTIKGLVINQFKDEGILVTGASATGVRIQGCFIGTDVTGELDRGNFGHGIEIASNAVVTVGSDTNGVNNAAERNLVSGNNTYGMFLGGYNNYAMGNFVGTDKDGDTDLGNSSNGIGASAWYSVVGTNGDGTADAIEGNLLSGNDGVGLQIIGNLYSVFAGNLIGTKANGTQALGNSGAGVDAGGAQNRIGTNADGISDVYERNIISGNASLGGIYNNNTNSNIIAGNYIGLGIDGSSAVPNTYGIYYSAAFFNTYNMRIGTNGDGIRDDVERNVISGNSSHGILLNGNTLYNNIVAGNYIGLSATGSFDKGNGGHGIAMTAGTYNNIIGGDVASEANVIAYNGDGAGEYGIYVAGAGSDGNRILRNSIWSNQNQGIELDGAGANNDNAVPVITSHSCSGSNINIIGTSAGGSETIQIFDADTSDQEGEIYLGEGYSDTAGNWRVKIPNGTGTVVATATNSTDGTSEFSASFAPSLVCNGRRRVIIIKKQNL